MRHFGSRQKKKKNVSGNVRPNIRSGKGDTGRKEEGWGGVVGVNDYDFGSPVGNVETSLRDGEHELYKVYEHRPP